jgi:hypothetical protein
MIKQILKQIWTERRRNGWLLFELAVVSFFLLVTTDFLWIRVKNYTEPVGFNIDNTFLLKMKLLEPRASIYTAPEDISETPYAHLLTLADRIRLYPDVENVSISYYSAPYARGGLWEELRCDTAELGVTMQGRQVTTEYFDLLRIRTPQGEPIRIHSDALRQIVITEDVANDFFGSASAAIGKDLYAYDTAQPMRIVAVCSRFKNQEFEPYRPNYFEILPPVSMEQRADWRDVSGSDMLVRVRPGSARHFLDNFEAEMGERLRMNNLYVSSIVPSSDLRDAVVGRSMRGEIRQMGYVSLFVLITVCLGVFGTFWLRTHQRRGETGIRMAMGASKSDIRFWMIAESLCLMAIAILPSLLVYLNLLSADVMDTRRLLFSATRVFISLAGSVTILGATILSGVILPARQASAINPAEALNS